ncbi:DUF1570 domain-containing protein [Tuwongella immobilis]|uniref:: DUF1570 n=1 Tax=Tuwongella immobilis TaxID=692036 RepID=A0A6C2YIQ9_9BACT|nr:DUF1570 domain-containing protein [Tuwongella immobilis]VIP01420.1 : DUF1570 [Tuwongella immobilis]VTR98352.1 : DUF1570 [Tuwongella immobilis]
MRYWNIPILALLMLTLSIASARADFLVIRVLLNDGSNATTGYPGGEGGYPGGIGPMGPGGIGPMGPGGFGPMGPGGFGPMGPGGIGPMGPGGSGYPPGGFGPMGPGGGRGGDSGGAGILGVAPGGSGYPGAEGGGRGGRGPGGPGMGAPGLGGPGMGAPGMIGPGMGGPGLPGGQGGTDAKPKLKFDPRTMLMAVVRLKAAPTTSVLGGQPFLQVQHDFDGKTYIYKDSSILVDAVKRKSINDVWRERFILLERNRVPAKIFEEAEWTLRNGLIEESGRLLTELSKMLPTARDKMNPRQIAAAEAFEKLKPELDKPSADDTATVDEWMARLNYRQAARSEHYVMLHNGESAQSPEVTRKLDMLEENRKLFYYWFALNGRALPVNSTKLLTVQTERMNDFNDAQLALGADALTTDAFLALRQNIVVFAPHRLDYAYQNFMQVTRKIEQDGWQLSNLLKGEVPRTSGGQKSTGELVARAQTLALMERALIQESEQSSVSHEGSRQLLVAAGLMPRFVDAPEWLRFGSAAFFEAPKGPFPSETSAVKVAFWRTPASPSWAYAKYFNDLDQAKKWGKTPSELLRETLTDAIFRRARAGLSTTEQRYENREKALKKRDDDQALSRTLAWSLAYYLMKDQPAKLDALVQELRGLPRDLDFDDESKVLIFARAMGFAPNDKVDPVGMRNFAEGWFRFMRTQQAPVVDVVLDDSLVTNPSSNPNGGYPGGPGGSPAGPPGSPGGPGFPGGPGAGGAALPGGRGGR